MAQWYLKYALWCKLEINQWMGTSRVCLNESIFNVLVWSCFSLVWKQRQPAGCREHTGECFWEEHLWENEQDRKTGLGREKPDLNVLHLRPSLSDEEDLRDLTADVSSASVQRILGSRKASEWRPWTLEPGYRSLKSHATIYQLCDLDK